MKNMYSEVEVNENKMKHMNNNIKVKLNDQEKQSIESCLTEYECSTALKEMKNNESPGSDGITTERNQNVLCFFFEFFFS